MKLLHRNQATFFALCLLVLFSTGTATISRAEPKSAAPHAMAGIISGKVTETFDVTGYTYAEVNTGKEKVWAAGPITPLKVGDKISFSAGMPMKNFKSKSIKREFGTVYFVSQFVTKKDTAGDKVSEIASPHSKLMKQKQADPIKGINKLEGGNSIAEIHRLKQKLKGQNVRVRGKVTKFTAKVMGRNWIHIRDSSTPEDLTVTTQDNTAIGDVIVIEGKLEIDKDYSYGYVYPVIVENARITKE